MTISHRPIPPASDLLVARFAGLAPHNATERASLRLVQGKRPQTYRAANPILRAGEEIHAPHFIMGGWACARRELSDGRRQIISLLLPGDAIGLGMHTRRVAFTNIVALTNVLAVKSYEAQTAWRDRSQMPGLAEALDLMAAEDAFFQVAHITRLGRQNAYERIANVIIELEYRLSARGLSNNGTIPFPLTQETLGDIAGMSVVHVNRTLQEMRRQGRIELRSGRLSILDREALNAAGEFIPPVLSAPIPALHPAEHSAASDASGPLLSV